MAQTVAMGLMFYPRGGSAQVIRYLAAALEGEGWSTELACGSLGPPGERTNAETFFSGMRVHAADYGPAVAAFRAGEDPMAQPLPVHPSYEDRQGVPDRLFAAVSPELGERMAGAWERFLGDAFPEAPDLLHLHHLTPIHEACGRLFPDVPLVTHLHGTELKFLERAEALRRDPAAVPEGTRPESWTHAGHWVETMRRWAERSDRLVVISPNDREEAARLLGVEGERVEWAPNGVDTDRFDRVQLSPRERLERWRRWLVDEPLGWREGGEAGSVGYREAALERFADAAAGEANPVLLFVGRFTEVKRIPLLIRAYARARERFTRPAPLVIWGGFPGEWEGEHPVTVAESLGVQDVFFVGWRGHEELGEGLACSDVMVMPSINESFGQVFVEAMACGVPVIAANAGGPPSFVNVVPGHPNGWLVEPDSLDSLEEAMVVAVNDPAARAERAANGYESTRRTYAWPVLAKRMAALYEDAMLSRRAS